MFSSQEEHVEKFEVADVAVRFIHEQWNPWAPCPKLFPIVMVVALVLNP